MQQGDVKIIVNRRDEALKRIARKRASELREWAKGLREYVDRGKVETWRPERRSERGKLLNKDGVKFTGMSVDDGRKLIHEAERLELLATLTLESLGIKE